MEPGEPRCSPQAAGSGAAVGGGGGDRYALQPTRIHCEDILFCVDVDKESMVDMKTTTASGRHYTRIDSIKQAIIFFVTAKLTINPDHRFAYVGLGKSAFWLQKEFSNDADSPISAFRAISIDTSSGHADLTQLFRVAAHEAKKSRAQNRILRVILLYCRSSTPPTHQWPATQKLFTLDAIYLHDKPGPDNCPQKVYDSLVEALELVSDYEGYIFESGQGSLRVFLRHMAVLLSHPQQRCMQDYIDLPKSLTKKSPVPESATPADENAAASTQ